MEKIEPMERKFIIEISSTTREIEGSTFFRHNNRLFQQLLENFQDCYQQFFMLKEKR